MKYAQIRDMDISNGEGVGVSLFVQGCPIHCKECFNAETWNFDLGKMWTDEIEDKFVSLLNKPYIKRVSILGGSPLCDENVSDVCKLLKHIKRLYPEKIVWVYTGYNWEDITNSDPTGNPDKDMLNVVRNETLRYIDVLVDGPFECEKKDLTLAFRGSTNQRIIDVQKSIETGDVVLWNSSI